MPRRSPIDMALDVSAALAVLLALAAATWSFAVGGPSPQYAPGDQFDDIPTLGAPSTGSTLFIWIDTRCEPCVTSMPFYQRLTRQPRRTSVIVLGRETVGRLEGILAKFGVRPNRVVSVGNRTLRFRGTPTIVLVGQDARVRAVWYGRRQNQQEEDEVFNALE